MKKLLLIIACGIFSFQIASAQDVFTKKDIVINAGIGFGNTLHAGTGYKTTLPAISGSVDVCIVDNLFDANSSIGVGGIIGYGAYKYDYGTYLGRKYEIKYSDFILAARGTFHYQFVPKLDTYGGVTLGYKIVSSSSDLDSRVYSADGSAVFAGAYVGARYYFSDSFAAMAELGYDIAIFKIGVAFKF